MLNCENKLDFRFSKHAIKRVRERLNLNLKCAKNGTLHKLCQKVFEKGVRLIDKELDKFRFIYQDACYIFIKNSDEVYCLITVIVKSSGTKSCFLKGNLIKHEWSNTVFKLAS